MLSSVPSEIRQQNGSVIFLMKIHRIRQQKIWVISSVMVLHIIVLPNIPSDHQRYMQISFRTLDIFDREFRKLTKKYPSLERDFADFQIFLWTYPIGIGTGDIVRIDSLWEALMLPIYKVKSFRCFSLAKNSTQSGIRIIYVYDASSDTIEFIEFIEIYHKWSKEMEDRQRILEIYSWKKSLS